jgi:hypothetical protein
VPSLVHIVIAVLAMTAPSPASRPTQVDCFQRPSRCGYPDASNTGVPDGTRLRGVKSIRITRNGTTLDGLRITGTVNVDADDVTIRNTLINAPSGGSGSSAVTLEPGADDFRIEDSEISGPTGNHAGLESAVWNHYGNPGAIAVRSYFHHCADCWEGSGSFHNDYMIVNSAYSGSHDEDIYVCGAKVVVEHSTLINRHDQTATVFGDTAGCGGNRFKVVDSLLAGGGYVLYPQSSSDSPIGSMDVSGNRFSRCRSAPVYESDTGGTSCRGGPDANGVFPYGGYYGVAAYYFLGKNQIWHDNFWDDNLKPVCIEHSC